MISGEQINKFSTLVRRQGGKLPANDLTRLAPHVYRDYLKKIKHFAGKTANTVAQSLPQSINGLSKLSRNNPQIDRTEPQKQVRPASLNPSYYYSRGLEILSLKEFVVLLEESKRKQQREERAQSRLQERQLVKEVGRNIQSSHSRRNLRLTSSSAQRISQRMKQIQYQTIYDK